MSDLIASLSEMANQDIHAQPDCWEAYPYFDSSTLIHPDSDPVKKRTSWCLDELPQDNQDEDRLRQELIQRATTRLRRRMLEQSLQDVMSQVVSLQTQLETLRLDAATTIDTVSNIADESKSTEGTQRMNRQLDVLERRLKSHQLGLYQLQNNEAVKEDHTVLASEAMAKTDSFASHKTPLTALSMSRLSSMSIMSSIFGRPATPSSSATSISDNSSMPNEKKDKRRYSKKASKYNHQCQETVEDDDSVSQIESFGSSECHQPTVEEEDHPFYDLAGKRSFGAGSFCGSVYHDNQEKQQLPTATLPVLSGNTAEIRSRRRQRRQRHQRYLEQQRQQQHDFMSDDGSVISDDVSTYSSISSLSNIVTNARHEAYYRHPLSPVTPPPHFTGSFFEQMQQPRFYKDPMQSWLSSHEYDHLQQELPCDTYNSYNNSIYPQRNVLDEAMSFLDGISENGDDGGFGEDVYLLLRRPDLCCRPLSEIETTMNKLRQQEHPVSMMAIKDVLHLLNPAAWCQLGIKYSSELAYNATCSSLQWCRFLSVLAAAVVISVLKGPEDIRRYSSTY
jgi:hypothetical protein